MPCSEKDKTDTGTPYYKVYVVLEGGGAKGIAHVAALKAFEEFNAKNNVFQIVGYAGTSAGSIVAALSAAGWKPDDIVKYKTCKKRSWLPPWRAYERATVESPLLSSMGINSPTQLFGPGGWAKIWLLRFCTRNVPIPLLLLVGCFLLTYSLVEAIAMSASILIENLWPASHVVANAALKSVVALALMLLFIYRLVNWLARGLAATQTFEEALNRALAAKVRGLGPTSNIASSPPRPTDWVRFREVPLLKIVAANIDEARLAVFSRANSSDLDPSSEATRIARAVVASSAIPVVFKPVVIDSLRHVDGGIVSNLPVWLFENETYRENMGMTLTFEIDDTTITGPSPIGGLLGAVRSTLFGSRLLEKNVSAFLEPISLNVRIDDGRAVDVLDFDLTPQQWARVYQFSKADAAKKLRFNLASRNWILRWIAHYSIIYTWTCERLLENPSIEMNDLLARLKEWLLLDIVYNGVWPYAFFASVDPQQPEYVRLRTMEEGMRPNVSGRMHVQGTAVAAALEEHMALYSEISNHREILDALKRRGAISPRELGVEELLLELVRFRDDHDSVNYSIVAPMRAANGKRLGVVALRKLKFIEQAISKRSECCLSVCLGHIAGLGVAASLIDRVGFDELRGWVYAGRVSSMMEEVANQPLRFARYDWHDLKVDRDEPARPSGDYPALNEAWRMVRDAILEKMRKYLD
jgi:NTE family protein